MWLKIKNGIPSIGIILMVALTMLTTIVGGQEIAKQFLKAGKTPIKNTDAQVKSATIVVISPTITPVLTPSSEKTVKASQNKTTPSLGNVLGISTALPTITPTNTPQTSNRCIITLFGKQYDITSLKSTHSGGDVFACGTDMTTSYQDRHGTNLSIMNPYLISSGNPAPAPTMNPTPVPTNRPTPTTRPPANQAGRCIITLFGKQYDITPLLSTHSGGNIFTCGTDMTSVYQSRHGTNVSMMAPYLINPSSPTPLPSPTPTRRPSPTLTPSPKLTPTPIRPTPTPRPWDDDEEEEDDD